MKKSIGIKVNMPKQPKEMDKNDPFFGKISLRGRTITGTIVKQSPKTATIEWNRQHYIPKYERYEKRISRIQVHVPESLQVKVGDKVTAMETRKISKTKNFVIIEVKQ